MRHPLNTRKSLQYASYIIILCPNTYFLYFVSYFYLASIAVELNVGIA